jgi:undecaprenyl diphosphate synthase
MDGNGRWAKQRGLKRSEGHRAGSQNLRKLTRHIFESGVKVLSLYAFSTENFKRDKEEVNHLMDLFVLMFKKEKNFFIENDIKVVFSGADEPLPKKVIKLRDELTELTKNNKNGIVNICLNYGGRREIVDTTKKIIEAGLKPEEITEEVYEKYLYQDLPPVDLMIRTSGELRLSNFLLWQNAYAEFYFPEILFPDFTESDFDDAILVYNRRDRRFGNAKK